MDTNLRSWVLWSTGLAAIAAGAWMLSDDRRTDETSSGGAGAARQLPVEPVKVLAPPTTTRVSSSSAGAPASAANTDRFKLVGVMTLEGANVAMIAVDGQRARMFRVGELLDDNLQLREIAANGAVIGPRDGGTAIALKNTPPPSSNATLTYESNVSAIRDLSDGSVESESALRKMGARNAPMKAPTAAEQASAADASVPTDPGRWHSPGQP